MESNLEPLPDCREAKLEAQIEFKEFMRLKKNKTCALQHLVKLAQRIELCWDSDEALRLWLLDTYRDCLGQFQGSPDKDLEEIGRLGYKMRNSIRFSLQHFLVMALPTERKYTKGLKEHEFLVKDVKTLDTNRGGRSWWRWRFCYPCCVLALLVWGGSGLLVLVLMQIFY